MSVAVMAWAWKQQVSSTETLVLLALADHSDDSGFCWPGQSNVGAKCKLARETVNRIIKQLETKGLLSGAIRYDEAGRTIGKSYRLKVDGPVTDGHRVCDGQSHLPVTEDHTEPSEENHQEKHQEEEAATANNDPLKPEDLVEAWNEQCRPLGLGEVRELSGARRQKLNTRIREHPDPDWWSSVLAKIKNSRFCRGDSPPRNGNGKPWRASFDWMIDNDTNALKALEGKYDG